MREIKFRCWIKLAEVMGTVEEINLRFGSVISIWVANDGARHCRYQFSEIELMQYTGLKDKNGIDIYEGDILKKWYSRDTTGEDITEWNEAVEFEIALNRSGFTIDFLPSCEIIGNIYEHPHLLSITPNPQDNKK